MSCFWLNGSSTNKTYVPCDPSASNSPCCIQGHSCLSNGLCMNTKNLYYRGGCTDSIWKDSACPKVCSNTAAGAVDSGQVGDYSWIKSCVTSLKDTDNPPWVCGASTACTNPFYLGATYVSHVNITGNATQTAGPTQLVTIIAAPKSSSSDNNKATVVGAAVGSVLGVALLLALGWALWERRKKALLVKQYEAALERAHMAETSRLTDMYKDGGLSYTGQQAPVATELPTGIPIRELPAGSP